MIIVSIKDLKDIDSLKADGYVLGYEKYTFFAPQNFSYEEVKKVSKNNRIFLLLNALIHEKEVEEVKKEIDILIELDISFIIQDLGLLSLLISKGVDKERIIYNPYTLICNNNDYQAYQNAYDVSLGISSQLSLEEKIDILNNNNKVFVQIYGYEPIYQSYRKVISLYQEARDKKFDIKELSLREDTREEKYPIIENEYGSVIFNYQKIDLSSNLNKINHAQYMFVDSSFSSLEEVKEFLRGISNE